MSAGLAVDDGGQGGIPVVFLHSLAGTATHWSTQLAHLRPTRRALAVELPGHGASPPPPNGDYTIEAVARVVARSVAGLGLDRVVLAGHSFGGGVALECAGAQPERVAGLLLLDPISDGRRIPAAEVDGVLAALDSPAYTRVVEGYWTGIAGSDAAVRDRLLGDLRRTPREAVVGAFRAFPRYDPTPALERYRGPRLSIVTPRNDGPASLHRLGAGFTSRVVEGTGHWIQLERPEEVNRLVDEFLEQVRSEKEEVRRGPRCNEEPPSRFSRRTSHCRPTRWPQTPPPRS